MQRSRADVRGTLALLAIGLPLLGVSAGSAWFLVRPDLETWLRARDFVEVEAELLALDLETSHSARWGTSERARARYRYLFDGTPYESERVAISDGLDNIGHHAHDLHARLAAARARGQTVPAWVDPERPASALLDRELRWGLLALESGFSLAFALVGLAFVGGALHRKKEEVS